MEATKKNADQPKALSSIKRPEAPRRAWYVLRAISGKEAKVKELLDGAIKNTDLGNYVSRFLFLLKRCSLSRTARKL